jgi:hypothetical protein
MVLKTMKKLHKPYLAVVEALISSVTVILLWDVHNYQSIHNNSKAKLWTET